MFIYLVIYIPFVFSSYFDFINKVSLNVKKRILIFWVVIFSLFRGLRWNTGTDWDQFYYCYEHSHWNNIFSYSRYGGDELMDYGYMFINALFHEIGFSYTIFLLFVSFVIQLSFYHFSLKLSKYPILTMIMLMTVGVPFPVRQTLSFAIALISITYLVDNRIIKFFIIAVASSLIHKAAIVIMPFCFVPLMLSRFHIKWYHYLFAYVGVVFFAKIAQDYIQLFFLLISASNTNFEAYSGYSEIVSTSVQAGAKDFESGGLLAGLNFTILFLLSLYVREKYLHKCKDSIKCFETIFFMYAISAYAGLLVRISDSTGLMEVLMRISSIFDMYPLIYPLIFVLFLQNRLKNIGIPWILFVIYACYRFWKQIPGSTYSDLFIPYHSILD